MKKWTTKHDITVIRLDGVRCNCFVIQEKDEVWLIDASSSMDRGRMLRQLEENQIHSISGIILTHAHINHVENAAWFAREYQCPVYIHDSELHFVQTGDCVIPKAAKKSREWIEKIVNFLPFLNRYPACRDAQAIPFEEPLIWNEFIKIIETPGHSEGSISIVIDDEIAIVADLMRRVPNGGIELSWANQPGLVEVSWKKLLQEQCEWFLPSHGKEIHRRLIEKVVNKE